MTPNEKIFNCIIVDDEPLAVELLNSYAMKTPGLKVINTFSNSLDALEAIEKQKPDFVLMDVQMPELNGIQLTRIIKNKCFVILTTAYTNYAVSAFENEVVDYLVKPISYDRFAKAINRVVKRLNMAGDKPTPVNSHDCIFVKSGYKLIKIAYTDILYIGGMRDYTAVHTAESKILTLQSMSSFEESLPKELFIRIHKSYIVNAANVTQIDTNCVKVANAISLPVGAKYSNNLQNYLLNKNM